MPLSQRELVREIEYCRHALFDLDGTAIDGNAFAGIGYGYLKQERENRNWRNVAIGLRGGLQAEWYRRTGMEQKGLRAFMAALNRARCADGEGAYAFARTYVKEHGFGGLNELVGLLRESFGITSAVYTGGLDVSAAAAKEEFGFDGSFANYAFSGNLIVPSKYASGNPDKLGTAERYLAEVWETSLSDCMVVGDAETDIPLMTRSRLALASPRATKEVVEAADFWARDYPEVCAALRAKN